MIDHAMNRNRTTVFSNAPAADDGKQCACNGGQKVNPRAEVPMNSAAYFLPSLIQTFLLLLKIEMRFANALGGSA
jgi:hypothetical protein